MWLLTPLFSCLPSSFATSYDCPCSLLRVAPSSSSSLQALGEKECYASTSLIPSLPFHRPSLTPRHWGFTFLRTQRGCGPGPGTIVKTSLSTFDPSLLSSPSDPWLYHDFMVLSFCPRSLLIWTDVSQKRKKMTFVLCL